MTQNSETLPPRPALSTYPWSRIVLTVLFLAFLWLAFWATLFVAIAQLVLRFGDSDGSDDLRSFAARLGTYMAEIVDYVGLARETPPFPFSRFPTA